MTIPGRARQASICAVMSLVLAACSGARLTSDPLDSRSGPAPQAACGSLVPASQGGPMPTGDVAILRWLGTSNYELAYHSTIIIMDTFYDRPARTAPLGFTVDQVRRADVILIGHAHFDHISDVAPVAAQTGAPVVGSAITTTEAIALGVPRRRPLRSPGTKRFAMGISQFDLRTLCIARSRTVCFPPSTHCTRSMHRRSPPNRGRSRLR
jgi:hypothetical protein